MVATCAAEGTLEGCSGAHGCHGRPSFHHGALGKAESCEGDLELPTSSDVGLAVVTESNPHSSHVLVGCYIGSVWGCINAL